MEKIYVLDTNVLLQDPHAIFSFERHEVVIPAVVLEEIDSKKRNLDQVGKNARYISRLLDSLRANKKLHEGTRLPNGGILRVELNHRSSLPLQEFFLENTADNRILAVALNLLQEERQKNKEQQRQVILVSKDALLRIKADAVGLYAEDYLSDQVVRHHDLYKGYQVLSLHPSFIDQFYLKSYLELSELEAEAPFYPYQYVILKDELGSSKSAIGRVHPSLTRLEMLRPIQDSIWGLTPRNAQQKMALDLLLDDQIPLVTLTGRAGTGKTLLSLAVGLHKTEDEKRYHKLLITRPIVPMGRDIGFLPGEKEEKLRPWMQPFYDNLEYLMNHRPKGRMEELLYGLKTVQMEALTYIRGRSIPGQFMIIDEAQNLTRHEIKTILTRVGDGSKIVLLGDTEQIDHPYLDETNNGLTYVVERFKEQTASGHVKLEKGERSRLAQLAADLL